MQPSAPLGSYREFLPEALVPDQELYPAPPGEQAKSVYSASRRPMSRDEPGTQSKRSAVNAQVIKSITGVTTVGSLAPSRGIKHRKDRITKCTAKKHCILHDRERYDKKIQMLSARDKPVLSPSGPLFSLEELVKSQDLVAKMSGKEAEQQEMEEKMKDIARKQKIVHKRIWAEERKDETEECKKAIDEGSVEEWIKKLQNESRKEENDGAFVYLRQREGSTDPYDLVYCNYNDAEQTGGRFYTLSKKGFTSYFRNEATEFLTIVEWIMERELYEQIKSFKFFKLFRLSRAIKFWRHNVIYEKRNSMRNALERKLIVTRKGFRELIIQQRMSCRQLERLRLFDTTEPDDSMTLRQYEQMQDSHMRRISEKISEVSDRTKDKFLEEITRTLDLLKEKIRKSQQKTEEEKETLQQQTARNAGLAGMLMAQTMHQQDTGKLMAIDAVYEHLGFQSNLSYAHRTDVRKECKMFIRVSYLLDFIAKSSLKELYLNSMQMLDKYLRMKNEIEIPRQLPVLKTNSEFVAENSGRSIVCIHVSFREQEIPEEAIKYNIVPTYEPPPVGTIDVTNFDPTCHLQLMEGNSQEISPVSPSRISRFSKTRSATVEGIRQYWLRLSPEPDDVERCLKKCLRQMLEVIKNYERHSKNEVLNPYASVLEEWDEKVADKWEIAEDKRLTCEDLLIEEKEYLDRDSTIEKHMNTIRMNVNNYLDLFNPILIILWRYSRIDWDIIINNRLREPAGVFGLLVDQIWNHKESFDTKVPTKSDLGFIRLNLVKARDKIKNVPSHAHKKLDYLMPSYIAAEAGIIKDWLEKWTTKINEEVKNAIQYVDQIKAIQNVETHFEQYSNRREIIKEFMNICRSSDIKAPKEDLYNELLQLSAELTRVMNEGKDKGERRKEEFKKELKEMIEKVKQDTEQLEKDVNDPFLLDIRSEKGMVLEKIEKLKERCDELKRKADQCVDVQQALEIETTNFEIVEDVKAEINIRSDLWQSLQQFEELVNKWKYEKFSDVNTEMLSENSERHSKIALRCENRGLKDSTAVRALKKEVIQFKETMPVVEALSNKRLKDIHWMEIKTTIGTDEPLENREFTLDNLISLNTALHKEEIHNISVTASQEYNLEQQIISIEKQWEKRGFDTKTFVKEQQRDQITIISKSEILFADLDDTLSALNNIIGSRYVRRLLARAIEVKQKFDMMAQVADEWVRCQRNWMYLDSIFSSPDIRSHLKKETTDFELVDKTWRPLAKNLSGSKNVLKLHSSQEFFNKLEKLNKAMERIKKELQNYLETKRKEFPRFYFLSDGELLPIMSKSTDITASESILPKCFDGIYRLDLGTLNPPIEIAGMLSAEEEQISFKAIRLRNDENIVIWLKQVETHMQEILKRIIRNGYMEYTKIDNNQEEKYGGNDPNNKNELEQRNNWILNNKSQVVSCVTQIIWTWVCEITIKDMEKDGDDLFYLLKYNIEGIKTLISLIQGELTPLQRKIIISIITTDVHWRDIFDKLASADTSDPQDFLWQSQLRFYFDESSEEKDVIVRQVNSEISYGYEYMGATSRLVVTPLTERCYLTITQALHIYLGAAPAGPAGTGKTETVKDLSKAMAIQCVVFNCSEQIEIKIMARLFSGLAQQGAWACLDEFNRIDIEVLSVIAQQVLQIRDAMRAGQTSIIFNEIEMNIKPLIGIFVTMNPNYSGRTELPDNLKILFRPVSMMIPDYALIAENLLLAQGFQNAKNLALKMTQLYKLASEQLSQQDHYDFGMRAIKSVLVIAGSLKKREPEITEDVLLIRAMRDANVPKFLVDDLQLFLQLIKDLFPDYEIPEANYGLLTSELMLSLEKYSLSPGNYFVQKAQQLFESLNVRFGVMVIGLPGVGKTTCYQILQHAMTNLKEKSIANKDPNPDPRYQRVEIQSIFPKAISLGELYGEESKDTKEWKYGVASKLMRKASATISKRMTEISPVTGGKPDSCDNQHWIVFDGPVDSKWIENMNSVLDDSRMLCLANAERIKLPEQMRMLFEVQDLACASLATVSRCGMVYITPSDIGWEALMNSWWKSFSQKNDLFRNSDELKSIVAGKIDECVERVLALIKKLIETMPIPSTTTQLINSFTANLEYWFNKIRLDEALDVKKRKVLAYFAYSLVWGFGGPLPQRAYPSFDDIVRPMFQKLAIPFSGTLFDYVMEPTESGQVKWINWRDVIPHFKFTLKDAGSFFSLFVPTADTEKYSFLMENSVNMMRPTFFTGETGVGKSSIIRNVLWSKQTAGEISIIPLVFSATTSSLEAQLTIEAKLEPKKFRKVLGPTGQTKGIIFIDDVNMPIREISGAQPPIELLRQFITYKGFYGRTKPYWTEIVDSTVFCAAAPPEGGRNVLSQRFTQRFSLFCLPEPSEDTLRAIFESILMGFLQVSSFPDPVRKVGTLAVAATIDLYVNIQKSLRPTPSKFHYIFNLRDLSKVFQCMLLITPKTVSTAEVFTRLWIHECMRIFGDRLVTKEDRSWLQAYIVSLIASRFRYDWSEETVFEKRNIIFTDIYRLDYDVDERPYEEVLDINRLARVLDDVLLSYNQKNLNNKMDLVFFNDAVCYIARISRTLRQKRGSCLLIGVSGCGKESYTNLAAFILDSRFFKIRIGKNYRRDNFKDEIKVLMMETGVEGKSITFMMNDNQLSTEFFLEDINSILNTGEINNLFKPDEMDAIIRDMSPVMTKLKRVETKESKYSTFLERIRDNLHIVLSMSPVGEAFRARCRKYPSLINCCTLIYFDKWPGYALNSVCSRFLGELGYLEKGLHNSLTKVFPQIHLSVEDMSVIFYEELRRKFYVTPKSYIDAIKFFIHSLEETKEMYSNNIDRLSKGLKNFHATTRMVSHLQEKLTRLRPIIEENTKKANDSLELKQVEALKVQEEDAKIETEKNILYQQQALIEVSQAEAEKELGEVKPILDKAVADLDSLNPKDIVNIRGYTAPPKNVIIVMQAVIMILENDKTKHDWHKIKEKLVKGDVFIKQLKAFDYKTLSESTIRVLRNITINFDLKEILNSDTASVSLANWSIAMVKCYDAYQKVAPQEEKLRKVEAEHKKKMAEVKVMEDALDIVKQKLRKLENEHKKLSEEARILNEEKEHTEMQLLNAEELIHLLGAEGERWTQTVAKLKEEEKELLGNIFLSAVSISYISPFTMVYRNQLMANWQDMCCKNKIIFSPDYSIIKTLGNPMEVKRWNLQGLPADNISVENGILATKSKRWPLMIDPEGQANKWIKNLEKKNNLVVNRMNGEDLEYVKAMDNCIQGGRPLLLEDVQQEFDSSLYTVLGRKTFKSDVGERINFGDKDIPYDPNFRLYLTCKQANPHFLPEICIMLSVINFAVTFDALEEQLLVEVIINEKPEVEEERTRCITQIANFQKQLRDIESGILEKLTNTNEETILDDIELIDTLKRSKKSSIEIEKNIKEATVIEVQVNKAREQYREVATRGAILYFVLVDIAKIDPMYQYSFSFMKKLFNDALAIPVDETIVDERKAIKICNVTNIIYRNICRGLFEIHKQVFSFLITTQIKLHEEKIAQEEWDLFIRGAGVITKKKASLISNPLPHIISEPAWNIACVAEEKIGAFLGFTSSISSISIQWADFAKLKNPYYNKKEMPGGFGDKLSNFQRLIVMRILKPEKVRQSCNKFVEEELGSFYTDNPSVRIDDLFNDSSKITPIIFILSQGADPTEQIKAYTKESEKNELVIMSLGKEQELRAEKELTEAKKSGRWLLLQNCHLAKSFMPKLESLISRFEDEESTINDNFRLLLSSMPVEYFPISVLQNGLKYTTEPPAGIRANVLRTYCDFREVDFEGCRQKRNWKILLYGMAMFHAVVQERRKFGPLGWNVRYEFNETDLSTSRAMLFDFLEMQEEISWDALSFITGEINYGGRVTDSWDRKLLNCLFGRFLNPQMLIDSEYHFTESGKYLLPQLDTLKEFTEYVGTLPDHDEPEIFGMHDNADITYETRLSENLLNSILEIQPKIRPKSAGRSNDEIVLELVTKLKETLPDDLIKEQGLKELFEADSNGMINSLSIVLIHEIDKYNRLLSIIRISLEKLEKAVKGEVVMSQDLDDIYGCLLMFKVPPVWKIYDSLKPLGGWFPDLISRIALSRS